MFRKLKIYKYIVMDIKSFRRTLDFGVVNTQHYYKGHKDKIKGKGRGGGGRWDWLGWGGEMGRKWRQL